MSIPPAAANLGAAARMLCAVLMWPASAPAGSVDSDRAIRKFCRSAFLDHDILLRDMETLLLEERLSSEPQ